MASGHSYDHAVRKVRERRRSLAFSPLILAALILSPAGLAALENERYYLSGTGYDDTRDWQFQIDRGRRSGEEWTTIAVPSQWEQQGFGTYRYGRHDGEGGEVGIYRHRFRAPADWVERKVLLVFEGVMTDTRVRLNEREIGPPHQGGFTRFSYDVTEHLRFAADNLLEVTVSETSADSSVEAAERQADYWVFGGIYRPVYLEASPSTGIAHLAIDAEHGGRLRAVIELQGAVAGTRVAARVTTLDGESLGRELAGRARAGETALEITGVFSEAASWSAERPVLYQLEVSLLRGEELLHTLSRRFGFRSIEVRPGEGLFVNGRRVLLRGFNRHSFWPDSGRTLNREINYRDVELLKEINANAVRASHYPPDEAFLDACDELGLYVIDELPGWHDAYRTEVGRRLVREMVRRDVNHPSILFWANGNEGGWNDGLDRDFALHDPQDRPVLHPNEELSGIETEHYVTYNVLSALLNDETLSNRLWAWLGRQRLVMPTEMLHGLYDGGIGAGLASFWKLISTQPRGVGAFLWAFLDEGIVRTDRGGEIDTFGNYAPDGVVGPYRQKEASFRTVRRLWSPIQITASRVAGSFDGAFRIQNRFTEIDLVACRFEWRAMAWPGPEGADGVAEVLATGEIKGPAVPPGETGELRLQMPAVSTDAVEITAYAPDGRDIETWSFPVGTASDLRRRWIPQLGTPALAGGSTVPAGGETVMESTGRRVSFDGETGLVIELAGAGGAIPLRGGPRLIGAGSPKAREARSLRGADKQVYSVVYEDDLHGAVWTLFESGWLRLEYEYPRMTTSELDGIAFELEDEWIRSIEWLGRGPDPVWLNRLAGPRFGLWRRDLSEVAPGRDARGFYSGVLWMRIVGDGGVLTVVPASDDLHVGISAPDFPDDSRSATAEVPRRATLSFLHRISTIGSKFHRGSRLYDHYPRDPLPDTRTGTIWFYWQTP